jgi:hypothetical protein
MIEIRRREIDAHRRRVPFVFDELMWIGQARSRSGSGELSSVRVWQNGGDGRCGKGYLTPVGMNAPARLWTYEPTRDEIDFVGTLRVAVFAEPNTREATAEDIAAWHEVDAHILPATNTDDPPVYFEIAEAEPIGGFDELGTATGAALDAIARVVGVTRRGGALRTETDAQLRNRIRNMSRGLATPSGIMAALDDIPGVRCTAVGTGQPGMVDVACDAYGITVDQARELIEIVLANELPMGISYNLTVREGPL